MMSTARVLQRLIVLVAATMSLGLQVALAQITHVASVEGITEYRLANGLRVLLFPDPGQPTITVNITYLVGSRHEAYGETGMAHLLEHLVFKGTPNHPDIPQELTERGALPNGTTWFDRTNYFETFPATEDNLDWALDLEADRMINSFISAEDLESEMTVVRNEMEAGENNPFRILLQRTLATAYLWHNYGNSTIGARSDVENVPIGRLQAFYRKYYQPDNAILVIAGKFEPETTLALVEEKFGAVPRPDRTGPNYLYPTYTTEPTQDGERSVTLRRVGDVQYVMASYHVPAGSHAEYPAVQIVSHALSDRPSGRLHKALVETGKAARIGAIAYQLKEAGPLLLYAEVREENSLEDAWRAMDSTLTAVVTTEPITDEEVERARTELLKNIELNFNNPERIAFQLSEWAAMGDWRLMFLHRDRLEAVQTADAGQVAWSYLKPQNRTVGYFIPSDEADRAQIPAPPDVTALVSDYKGRAAVASGEVFDPSIENVEARTTRVTFPSGFQVAMLPKETRGDNVVVTFRVLYGTAENLMNKAGAAQMAAGILMRGTARRTRQELMDEIDRLKARVSVGGGVSSTGGFIETTRENLPAVLRLVGEVMREPGFDEQEFTQLKAERLSSIESQKSEPSARASIAFRRHLAPWPKGHPRYTPTLEESAEIIDATTAEQARQFYEDFYGADRGHLAIVGDFDADDVEAVLSEIFGDWRANMTSARIINVYRDIPADRIVIETPDKANAFFRAGMNILMRDDHPDYPALELGNFMLGGGFLSSRLAVRIRQKEGLSYGVSSSVFAHPADEFGQFTGFAIAAPENMERVEAAFREELERVLADGYTPEEVANGKQGYLQFQENIRARDQQLAGALSQHLYFGRTMAWDADLEQKIQALTPDEILAAMRRHIDPSKVTVVMAGDFAKPVP